ncbi:MAG: arsenate reductase (glutaredoxin) [Burkholderiaceae bacterium]
MTATMTTIYHNPRCSKSRETLALLHERGIEPRIVLYLQDPPDAPALQALFAQLDRPITEAIRFKEAIAKALGLSPGDERSDAEWCRLIAEHPVLLERPIVTRAGRARLGRPPQAVLDIL